MSYHDETPLGSVHQPFNWEYANTAARTGASGFVSGDVGKFARQLDDDSIWMLTAVTPTWAPVNAVGGIHASAHQNGGGDEISVAGLSGELADDQPPKAHALGTAHSSDTLANLNAKISDATLSAPDDTAYNSTSWNSNTDAPTKNAVRDKVETMDAAIGSNTTHRGLTNNPHGTDVENLGAGTLAELNGAISDATLDDSGDPRTDNNAVHDNVASEISAVTAKGTPIGADFLLIEDSADSNNKKRITVGTLPAATPASHASSHQNGGGDEINVAGLSGELADDQPPKAHGSANHTGNIGAHSQITSPGANDHHSQSHGVSDHSGDIGAASQITNDSSVSGAKVKEALETLDSTITALENGLIHRDPVINIVDCTQAPPTEVSGDRYIIDNTGGTVHADYDGASKNDIVDFNGSTWDNSSPEEGWLVYVDALNQDALFIDDGTPQWQLRPVAVTAHGDLSGVTSDQHHNQSHGASDHSGSIGTHSQLTSVGVNDHHAQLHDSSHENGGGDEISVAGLSGLLADDQNPVSHASDHQDGGADEISVTGLSGLLADDQNPTAHAAEHVNGTDDIQNATNAQKGVATAAQITSLEALAALQVDLHKTGFLNQTDSVRSFINGSLTFSIQPAVTSYDYYIDGIKYTKTGTDNVVIDDTEGLHFIYFDGTTLKKTTTFSIDLVRIYAFVAVIYWDATNDKQLYFGDERHTPVMDWKTHMRLHFVEGGKISEGGALGAILINDSGDDDEDAEFSIEATEFWDEDINISHSAKSSTANIAVYYRSGVDSSKIWRIDETDSFGVLPTGTGRAAWNELTGGSWQQTEVTNNDFVLGHVFTNNDPDRRYGVFQGQNEYSTLALARAAAEDLTEINSLIVEGLPIPEWKFLGTIIYQTSDGYDNEVQARIRSTSDGDGYVDLRGSVISRVGTGVAGTLDIVNLTTSELGTAFWLAPDGLGSVEWVTSSHASSHENGGGDEISVAGLSGELADDQPPKSHALGTAHSADTLANLNAKISDATLDDSGDSRTDDNAVHDNVQSEISVVALKATPVSGDLLLIEDSADSNNKKRITVGTLPTGGSGEANTASNQGAGSSLVYQKSGIDLQFNGIKSENNRLGVSLDAVSHDIELTINEANIVHQNLSGKGTNTHTQIDTHVAATNNPHGTDIENLGNGTLAELNSAITDATLDDSGDPRTDNNAVHDNVASEISAVTAKGTPIGADFLLIEDSADSNNKKRITVGTLPAATPASHASSHQNGGGDEISVAGLSGELADDQPPKAHALGTAHSADTLANLNAKISDATLSAPDDTTYNATSWNTNTDAPTKNAVRDKIETMDTAVGSNTTHRGLTNNPHGTDVENLGSGTLAELNSAITDATLDSSSDSRTDDNAVHDNVQSEISVVALKATPVSGDLLLIEDSADSNNKKRITVGTLPTGGSGEANTASNQGAGSSLIYQKSGIDLQFNGIKSENNRLGVFLDAVSHDIELTINEANIVHQNLSGKGTNTHAQIDTHIAATNNPHGTDVENLGSGTLAELNSAITDATLDDSGDPRTDNNAVHDNVASEISAVTAKGAPIGADFLLIEDSADSNNKKRITVGTLPAATPASHASSHQNGGGDEISVAGLSGELADDQPPKTHALGTAHSADTLANLNAKISDATLSAPDDTTYNATSWNTNTDAPTKNAVRDKIETMDTAIGSNTTHGGLTNNPHGTDVENLGSGTLAELNSAITDATLDDSGDPRTDDDAIHDNVASEISAVTAKGTPITGDFLLIEDSADSNNKKRITIGTLPAATPASHDSSHENGGADEISVAGLSGELADDQPPKAHGSADHSGDIGAASQITNDSSVSGSKVKEALETLDSTITALENGLIHRDPVINVVDCTQAPPTEVSGDRYVIDNTGGTVHANWDGASKNDIVDFNGSTWDSFSPEEGWLTYVDTPNQDALFIDDGTPQWQLRPVAVTAHGDLSGVTSDQHHNQSHGASDHSGSIGTHSQLTSVGENDHHAKTHASTHQNGGADEISVADLSGLLADSQTPLSHALGTAHSADTLANLNAKISDATLSAPDDTTYNATSWNTNTDAPTKNAVRDKIETMDTAIGSNTTHGGLTNNPHGTDVENLGSGTLAELNSAITDATLDDSSANRTDANAVHDNVASEISAVTAKGTPVTGDFLLIEDSADSNNKKRITVGTLPAATPASHASSHQNGGGDAIKLDDLSAPDDNTDLNATTGLHGLLPKLGGGTTNFLRADGTWAAPAAASHASSHQNGGGDEISVAGLSGLLADSQTPLSHALGTAHSADTLANLNAKISDATLSVPDDTTYNATSWNTNTDAPTKNAVRDKIETMDTAIGSNTTHGGLTNNPHGTDVENLGNGTLAELNSAITDATLDDSGDPRTDNNAVHDNVASEISAVTAKGTPITADFLLIEDSADSNNKKRITVGTLPAATPASHASSHQNGGGDEISVAGLSGELADDQPPKAHALGTAHSSDTLANLNAKISDATLSAPDDTAYNATSWNTNTDAPTKNAVRDKIETMDTAVGSNTTHRGLTNNPHATDVENLGAGTLAELNAAITDATLDDSSDPRTDNNAVHDNVASEISAVTAKGTPVSGDFLLIEDSADSNNKKRITIGTLPAATPASHASSHQSGGGDAIKLDDLSAPDDNTDLNATTGLHGLLPKLGGGTTNFLRADGTWSAPPGGSSPDSDDTYDNFGSSPAIVTIDNAEGQGDLVFKPTGAFSMDVDISGVTGVGVDGFRVENGSDFHRLVKQATNQLTLTSQLQSYSITTAGTWAVSSTGNATLESVGQVKIRNAFSGGIELTSLDEIDFKDQYLSAAIQLSQSGTTALSGFTATAIVSALNELKTEVQSHDSRHQNGGADEISVAGLSGLLGDSQTPLSHALGTAHSSDTLANLNAKISDATLSAPDDTAYNATSWNTNTDAPTKNAVRDKVETMDTAIGSNTTHGGLTNNPHGTDVENLGSGTLAELNSAITDATLDTSSASRTPTSHGSANHTGTIGTHSQISTLPGSSAGYHISANDFDAQEGAGERSNLTGVAIDMSGDKALYKVMSSTSTFTASNPEQGVVVSLRLSGNETVNWPSSFEILSGTYDGAETNAIMIYCEDAATPRYWVTIHQEP